MAPLTVLVVGGGIAGLSAATALRRVGHNVVILERSPHFDNEVGAAIHVPPNASRPLIAWGMDARRARLVRFRRNLFADGRTLAVSFEATRGKDQIDDVYGGPWMAAHRADLHEELRALAFADDAEGWGTVDVRLGAEVVGFDPDTASVTLADGQTAAGDLLVVANGIHSAGPALITGHSTPAVPVGEYNFCYRFLIPTAVLNADPETRFWDAERGDGTVNSLVGPSKRLVSYTCRDNEMHNFVGLFNDPDIAADAREDWLASVDKKAVLERFSDFHPQILAVINKGTDFKQWPLLYRGPLPSWIKGRMVVIGDASHPMLPFQGQGGAQAVEDGVALGIAMAGATTHDAVPSRLAAFDKVRRCRASALQVLSNAGQDEAHKVVAEAARYIPAETVPKKPDEFYAFSFAYNVVREMVDTMRETVDPAFELPGALFIAEPVIPCEKK